METTNFKTIEDICSDIKENILNMDSRTVMTLHNEYCDNMSYSDDMIYDNDAYTVNEFFTNSFEALKSMFYGSYNPNEDFFKFDGYGNLESIDKNDILDFIDIKGIIYNICEDPYKYLDYVDFLTDEYIENIETLKEENK
jgi:hypothetical protein